VFDVRLGQCRPDQEEGESHHDRKREEWPPEAESFGEDRPERDTRDLPGGETAKYPTVRPSAAFLGEVIAHVRDRRAVEDTPGDPGNRAHAKQRGEIPRDTVQCQPEGHDRSAGK